MKIDLFSSLPMDAQEMLTEVVRLNSAVSPDISFVSCFTEECIDKVSGFKCGCFLNFENAFGRAQ